MTRKKQTKQLKLEMGDNPLKLMVDGKKIGTLNIYIGTDNIGIIDVKLNSKKWVK